MNATGSFDTPRAALVGGANAPVVLGCLERKHHQATRGFSLVELMIVVAIIAILGAIAYPSYTRHVAKVNRVAAQGCLGEYANYMERFYTTNLRYDQTPLGVANADPHLDCQGRSASSYTIVPASASTSYAITATPLTIQSAREGGLCGTLTLDVKGTRTPSTSGCWQ